VLLAAFGTVVLAFLPDYQSAREAIMNLAREAMDMIVILHLHIILRAIWASTAIINIQSSMKFSQSLRCNMLMHLHLIGQDIINIKKFTT